MPQYPKDVLDSLGFVSREEQAELLKLFKIRERTPEMTLIKAVLRDAIMFRNESHALFLKQSERISELEKRVSDLEEVEE